MWWGVQHLRGETQKAFTRWQSWKLNRKKEALCEHLADILGWRDGKIQLPHVTSWVCLGGRRKTSFAQKQKVSDMVTSRTWSESNLGHVWGAMERMLSFKSTGKALKSLEVAQWADQWLVSKITGWWKNRFFKGKWGGAARSSLEGLGSWWKQHESFKWGGGSRDEERDNLKHIWEANPVDMAPLSGDKEEVSPQFST